MVVHRYILTVSASVDQECLQQEQLFNVYMNVGLIVDRNEHVRKQKNQATGLPLSFFRPACQPKESLGKMVPPHGCALEERSFTTLRSVQDDTNACHSEGQSAGLKNLSGK
jgi:hypothetical protein